jgi:hypothetical protein
VKKYLALIVLIVAAACSEPEMALIDTSDQQVKTDPLGERYAQRAATMADTYDGAVIFKDRFNALDPAIKRSSVARGSAFDPADEYWGLPRTAGYEEVEAYCSGCHGLAIVMQQRVTPERWAELLTWMVEKQGMPPLEVEEQSLVQAYLTQYFSTSSD